MSDDGPFAEIVKMARINEPTQRPGWINYCCTMIAELAEAMERLEYNTAVALARVSVRAGMTRSADYWLGELRTPLPKDAGRA